MRRAASFAHVEIAHVDRPAQAALLIIFLTVFIDLLGFGMVLPLLPIYGKQFAEMHGFTEKQIGLVVGLLMSSFSAMQFLFLPIWGRLSDRFGRRPILIIGLAGSTFFYALFGVATMWRSLAGLFVTAHRRRHRGRRRSRPPRPSSPIARRGTNAPRGWP